MGSPWATCQSRELQKSGGKHGVILISLARHIALVGLIYSITPSFALREAQISVEEQAKRYTPQHKFSMLKVAAVP